MSPSRQSVYLVFRLAQLSERCAIFFRGLKADHMLPYGQETDFLVPLTMPDEARDSPIIANGGPEGGREQQLRFTRMGIYVRWPTGRRLVGQGMV